MLNVLFKTNTETRIWIFQHIRRSSELYQWLYRFWAFELTKNIQNIENRKFRICMKEQFKAVLFLFFVSVFHHQFKKIYILLKKICNLKSDSYNNVVIERQHITKIYFISYKTSKWQQSTNHLLLHIQWQ